MTTIYWFSLHRAAIVAANITLLRTFYLCIHAAFNGVSALIGALTPAESGKRGEEDMKCSLLYGSLFCQSPVLYLILLNHQECYKI